MFRANVLIVEIEIELESGRLSYVSSTRFFGRPCPRNILYFWNLGNWAEEKGVTSVRAKDVWLGVDGLVCMGMGMGQDRDVGTGLGGAGGLEGECSGITWVLGTRVWFLCECVCVTEVTAVALGQAGWLVQWEQGGRAHGCAGCTMLTGGGSGIDGGLRG